MSTRISLEFDKMFIWQNLYAIVFKKIIIKGNDRIFQLYNRLFYKAKKLSSVIAVHIEMD